MQALEEMVASLQEPLYRDLFQGHIERGLHPAEERFARYCLFALLPGFADNISERGEAAHSLLRSSLAELPNSPSSAALIRNFEHGEASTSSPERQIEEMIRIANIATLLQASWEKPEVQATEKIIRKHWQTLLRWSTVAGQASAWPIVLGEDMLWIYEPTKRLRGICLEGPGEQKIPIIFACSKYLAEDPDGALRVATHEMIHSAQRASTREEIPGWSTEERRLLLEAITEALAICRIGQQKPFAAEEISKRDYAYLVIALFQKMREESLLDKDFPTHLEEWNAGPLSLVAAFVGEPQEFMERAERAKGALALKHAEWLHSQERSQENSSGSFHILPQAPFLDEMLFPGDLDIISEVLSAL